MTLQELIDCIIPLCPNAIFDEGQDGEVVIHTGHAVHGDADWESGHGLLEPLDERV